jgi:release factor glutamine methyltransferase
MPLRGPDEGELNRLGLLAWASETLKGAGLPTPDLDAAVLLQWLSETPASRLAADPTLRLDPDAAARYGAWVHRREGGEPVSYITGHKAFMGLDLLVNPDVLLVRPLTRLVVEIALELVRLRGDAGLTAADVGTGSGAVAVALAVLEPRIGRIYATDASREALAVGRQNGLRYRLDGRVEWLEGDLLLPVPEPVDLVVANVPYVPERAEVPAARAARFEPDIAFDGGPDGTSLIRRLCSQLPGRLRPGARVVLEVGPHERGEIEAALVAEVPALIIHRRLPAGIVVGELPPE